MTARLRAWWGSGAERECGSGRPPCDLRAWWGSGAERECGSGRLSSFSRGALRRAPRTPLGPVACRLLLLLLPMLSPASTSAEAPVPRLTAKASKTDVVVGERFTVEVTAEGPAGTTWTFPAEAGSEEVDLRSPATGTGAGLPPNVWRYQAAAFALQETAVPPVEARYRLADGTEGEAASEPVPLRMVSALPKDPKEQTLADVRGPVPLSVGRAFWVALGLLLAALTGLAWWLLRRRLRAEAARPVVPEVPPDVEALRALDALDASGALAREEYRPFYIALTEAAKRYLERRLSAPVLEMTSVEMLAFVRDHGQARDLVGPLRDLAEAADRVKFAKGPGQRQEAERHRDAVRALVGTLEARLRPVAPAPGEAIGQTAGRATGRVAGSGGGAV